MDKGKITSSFPKELNLPGYKGRESRGWLETLVEEVDMLMLSVLLECCMHKTLALMVL